MRVEDWLRHREGGRSGVDFFVGLGRSFRFDGVAVQGGGGRSSGGGNVRFLTKVSRFWLAFMGA